MQDEYFVVTLGFADKKFVVKGRREAMDFMRKRCEEGGMEPLSDYQKRSAARFIEGSASFFQSYMNMESVGCFLGKSYLLYLCAIDPCEII